MSISKLVIKAYSDEKFGAEKGEFSASINPANLKITSSVDYEKSQGMGSPSMALRYNVSPPKELSFKLLFDNTGIFPDSDKNVKEQLDNLQNLVYTFQEDINAPYYVRVIWGVIDFKGKLTSLETSYTMFQSDGAPIRAEVDIVVLEEVDANGISKAIKAAQDAIASSNLTTAGTVALGAVAGATAGLVTAGAASAVVPSAINEATPNTASNATTAAGAGTGKDSELDNASAGESTNPNSNNGTDTASQTGDKSATGTNKAAGTEAQNSNTKKVEDTPGKANNAADAAGVPNKDNSKIVQTSGRDSLPSVSKNALGDANLAKKLGSLNGLDSLRNLASGLSLAVPLTLAGLLAMLLAMGKKYGSKGAGYLKKKAKSGKEKAVAAKDKVKSKL